MPSHDSIETRAAQRAARDRMVQEDIASRGIIDPRVLGAMGRVPRERFVPPALEEDAYQDRPLPIGAGQTISQPFMVARMVEALALEGHETVLEVGTGSGYAAAVLSVVAARVHSVERIPLLARDAASRLHDLGFTNVAVHVGDGTLGLGLHAPFDAILVSAGGPGLPRSLLDQLAIGGRLVMPVGSTPERQRLIRVVRTAREAFVTEDLGDVSFVPLVGQEAWAPAEAPRLQQEG